MPEHAELAGLVALQERLLAAIADPRSEPDKLRSLGADVERAGRAVQALLAEGLPVGAGELLSQARRNAARLVQATRREAARVEHSLEGVRVLARETRRRSAQAAPGRSCDVAG